MRPRQTRRISRVLVANRGEIAVRVMRTLRSLGLRSVAVCSDADRDAPHVRAADEVCRLGPAPSSESYLRGDAIIAAALEQDADAIHPGYGFLSENAAFAAAVEAAGLVYIGPTPLNISRLGDKLQARATFRDAGLSPVPGADGAVTPERVRRLAREVGLPLLLKAAAGGGGRGIRIVREPGELEPALRAAAAEAQGAFGSSAILAERYLERARHIEVQVLGDGRGGVRLFFERDCSLQRRLQKVLEETPAPGLDAATRERLLLAVGRAVAAEKYRGAGTVELLLSAEGEVCFLEMNTRIQVEHPVTETTAGVDLVAEQLAIASGASLPPWQGDLAASVVPQRGAAIELRVNAEDPLADFRPSIGTIRRLRLPAGPFLRVDSGVEERTVVTPHYDSLLAKVIAWGPDRNAAVARLETALLETVVVGVATTVPLGLAILRDEGFRAGRQHCQYLAERLGDPAFFPGVAAAEDLPLLAAATAVLSTRAGGEPALPAPSPTAPSAWARRGPWRVVP